MNSRRSYRCSLLLSVAFVMVAPLRARADGALGQFEAVWGLGGAHASRDMNELGSGDLGTGAGIHMRAATSLWRLVQGKSTDASGSRLTDWWATEIGMGYLNSDTADAPIWFDIRIEAALRAVLAGGDNFDGFVRAGYLTHWGTAGGAHDALFAAAGVRVAKVLVEAGYGVTALGDGDLPYMLFDLEYRFRGQRYVGLRFDRFAGDGTDLTNVRLTIGTH